MSTTHGHATENWFRFAFGKTLADFTPQELRVHASRAWNTNDTGLLRALRAEASKRGIQVT